MSSEGADGCWLERAAQRGPPTPGIYGPVVVGGGGARVSQQRMRNVSYLRLEEESEGKKKEMTLPIIKPRACVVVGSSFSHENDLLDQIEKITFSTPFGEGEIFKLIGCDSFLQFRHGLPHRLLPNQINWL